MLVGLDFDNTLANYDAAFIDLAKQNGLIDYKWKGEKHSLREYLLKLPNGELTWQKLQGKIYGKWMHKAILFDGVKDFLIECKRKNINVSIVSHKTIYGIHDEEKFSLREEAWKWMQNNGFFTELGVNDNNVYFESTLEEKINKITTLACTHYIDDLIEILTHPRFPKFTKRILFSKNYKNNSQKELFHFSDWKKINIDLIT